MAHKRTGGTTKNGRDSKSKRLGLKCYKHNIAHPGFILIRQRGTKYLAGKGAFLAKDYTIHALISGVIVFTNIKNKKVINVINTTGTGLEPATFRLWA
ncbi:MAG: putative 50S ribosomal subunit protein L27 [Candidatus Hodgkinia cicadicola]|nr:MAG: putative 50S ribosomal subunit protein L27 [Candidatus Hodgkinia cicadicola]